MDIFGAGETLFSLPRKCSRPQKFSNERHGSRWGYHHWRNGEVRVYAMEVGDLHLSGRTKCY